MGPGAGPSLLLWHTSLGAGLGGRPDGSQRVGHFIFLDFDGSTNFTHCGFTPEKSLGSNSCIPMQSCRREIHESFSVQDSVVLFLGGRVVLSHS